jgi:CheY-like chemotaxis protein
MDTLDRLARGTIGAAPAGDGQPLVLLVEDDATLRGIMRQNVEAHSYRVSTAGTAAEAVAAVHREAPAAMLLDINLPDGSGWDVLRSLRTQGQQIPTVVVSAVNCSRDRLAEFHPDAYLPKPFPMAALLAAIERLAGPGVTARRSQAGPRDMATEPTAAPHQVKRHATTTDPSPGPRDSQLLAAQHTAFDDNGNDPAAPNAPADESGERDERDEPVKYRVPRAQRTRVRTALGAHASPPAPVLCHQRAVDLSRGAGDADARQSCWPMEDVLCDLVADPANEINRILVAGATPASIAALEQRATARGLHASGASSPSLGRGWIRIQRPVVAPVADRSETKAAATTGGSGDARRSATGNQYWLARAAAWLQQSLLEARGRLA